MSAEIKRGEEAVDRGDLQAAEAHCREALTSQSSSPAAHIFAGRVAFFQGKLPEAESEYRQAAELQENSLPAVEGLASVQLSSNNLLQGAATYEQLVKLARTQHNNPKHREYLWRLAEVQDRLGLVQEAEDQIKHLLRLPLDSEEQRLEALCFLADLQRKNEALHQNTRLEKYLGKLQQCNEAVVKRSRSSLRLQVDAERADEQLHEEDSLAHTLREIVKRTLPCPRYAPYFELHLQIYLSRMGNYPPRSAARQEKRMDAMRECIRMITVSAGGCTTPFPFEAAIWLLEEQEELYGGTFPVRNGDEKYRKLERSRSMAVQTQLRWYKGNSITRMSVDRLNIRKYVEEPTVNEDGDLDDDRPIATKHELFGVKLAHQFPWLGSASVAVGLALRRRFLSDPDAPSTAVRRKQITTALRRGVDGGADSAAGWKALAELQYQNRQWQAAHSTACQGLEWSAKRRQAGHETLTGFALSLRLCSARCLLRLNRLDEAEYAFKILAGWTTDGECGFDELSGSPPTSIRQQALRGLAKIALQRGERDSAKAQYERLLGKALMGRGQPAEHWAHAEYAWLQFEDGDLQTAKWNLEKALEVAAREGCSVTDSEIAEHHFRLGRILWTMGGRPKEDPQQARKHFQAASLEDSDYQAQACAWLGHWYREIAQDPEKAKNCYEEALLLDPTDSITANLLKEVNQQLGLRDQAAAAASLAAAAGPRKSAFEPHSRQSFEENAPRGPDVDKLLSDVTEKAATLKTMQSAHSANSELAGYWTVTTT